LISNLIFHPQADSNPSEHLSCVHYKFYIRVSANEIMGSHASYGSRNEPLAERSNSLHRRSRHDHRHDGGHCNHQDRPFFSDDEDTRNNTNEMESNHYSARRDAAEQTSVRQPGTRRDSSGPMELDDTNEDHLDRDKMLRDIQDRDCSLDVAEKQIRGLDERNHILQQRLDALKERCEEASANREQALKERDNALLLCKKLGKELNAIKSSQQRFEPVTDTYIADMFLALRSDVWSMAIEFFGDEFIESSPVICVKILKHLQSLVKGGVKVEQYTDSPEHCPWLVESYIWDVIRTEILGQYVWAGKGGRALVDLRAFFGVPELHRKSFPLRPPDADGLRKLQAWSVSTVRLLKQSLPMAGNLEESVASNPRNTPDAPDVLLDMARRMTETLSPLVRRRDGVSELESRCEGILAAAAKMDLEMSTSVTCFLWFPSGEASRDVQVFDPAEMEQQTGEARAKAGDIVVLTLAPGLAAVGTSAGEGFQNERRLLVKQKVSLYGKSQ